MDDLIISQPMRFTVDVKNGIVERPQRESLMRGDKMANRIIAELVCGSEPFDITGVTVKGKFCRPPSGDEIDLAGEAKGNVAEVQLTDQCYTSGGHYEARVILVLGGVERTVLFISGDVLKSGSGNAAGDEETGGSGGGTGSGLPAGGTAGQVLVKVSGAQGDAIWKNLTAADVGALGKNETAVNAASLNGKSADKYQLVEDACTMELLWENASPTSEFAAQDLAVNMTGYSHVAVEWLGTNLDTYEKFSIFHVGGAGDGVQYQFQPAINYAAITLRAITNKSITSIAVRTCNRWYCANGAVSMTADVNTEMIPLRIYGIKGWKK